MTAEPNAVWWKRPANLVQYNGVHQGGRDDCVFASIAGAVNHLMKREIWTPDSLKTKHVDNNGGSTDFSVAGTAVAACNNAILVEAHNRADSRCRYLRGTSQGFADVIEDWIRRDGIVILSREVFRSDKSFGGWHMLTVVAEKDGCFQVWDTNGFSGQLTKDEILQPVALPNRPDLQMHPHKDEDAIAIVRSGV